jgi:flagellar motor switch protein FliN/FliY
MSEQIANDGLEEGNLRTGTPESRGGWPIEFINDVKLDVAVELGRTELSIDQLLKLQKGGIIELTKLSEEPLDLRVNGRLMARGEAVIVNEMFGTRITQILNPDGEDAI